MNEREMYPEIGQLLMNRGYSVAYEVPPHLGSARSVDVVGIRPRKRVAVTVEAKQGHYSQVMRQASVRLFISDFVYVSFPSDYAHFVLERRHSDLKAKGIGLICVDGEAEELLPAKQSLYVDNARRMDLINMAKISR